MSKRKRECSVSDHEDASESTKKEKTENEEIPTTKKNTEKEAKERGTTAAGKNNEKEPEEKARHVGESSKKQTAVNNSISTRKRKRVENEEAEEEPLAKQIKVDESVEKKEPGAKKISKARYSKNDCVCPPNGTQTQQVVQEEEAHIQVEEWRLHKFQSPIELKHDESIHHDHFDPLEFHGHWDDEGEATFTNNGFTATLRFHNRELPILKGGPLHDDQYVFEQLHFHWSEDDHSGCEHIFEGQAYSMEAHAVHYNQKYSDFIQAQNKPDGLAVVAFFIQATDNENNPCFDKLATAVKDIIKINSTTNVAPDCLTWFKDEAQCKGYYTYQGSLTTKPYTESVTWILYPQPIHVSREQVANFRSMKSTPCEQHNIKKNVRPIQTPPEHKKLNVFFARSHRHSSSE